MSSSLQTNKTLQAVVTTRAEIGKELVHSCVVSSSTLSMDTNWGTVMRGRLCYAIQLVCLACGLLIHLTFFPLLERSVPLFVAGRGFKKN